MFSRFFNLNENPFAEVANVRSFFSSRTHVNALGAVISALEKKKGLALVQGEVGTGKTLLCKLVHTLLHHSGAKTALILQPVLEGEELLAQFADEFGIPVQSPGTSLKGYLDHLNQFFLMNAKAGQSSILLIDEAHKLSFEALETIRLLTNLESPSGKIVQVVLFAQPELEKKLSAHHMRQIQQRVACTVTLQPLALDEVGLYLRHRIQLSGGTNYVRFDSRAVKEIHKRSRGLPRLINFFAELALSSAEANGTRLVTARFVREAVENSTGARSRGWKRLLMLDHW